MSADARNKHQHAVAPDEQPRYMKAIKNVKAREPSKKASNKREPLVSIAENSKRAVLNGVDLGNLKLQEYYDYEYIYLRNNEITTFPTSVPFNFLKVLDLSVNALTDLEFLKNMPQLKHLQVSHNNISTLKSIPAHASLESLCLSANRLDNFDGMPDLPNLRVLLLAGNKITSLKGYPWLSNLEVLDLSNNPLTNWQSYRDVVISVNSPNLVKLDGKEIDDAERQAASKFTGKVAVCVREGLVVGDGQNLEERAGEFLNSQQTRSADGCPVRIVGLRLEGLQQEGNTMKFAPIVQLVAYSRAVVISEHLVAQKFEAENPTATKAFLHLTNFRNPIALDQKIGSKFLTTLYLPPGDYEYCFSFDNTETLSAKQHITITKSNEDFNADHDISLAVQWSQSNGLSGFTPIDGARSLEYTLTKRDIGKCIKPEVICIEHGGDTLLRAFDITSPIASGAPTCDRVEIVGDLIEGSRITADVQYFGGDEGNSTFSWYRQSATGSDDLLVSSERFYDLTLVDVGSTIRLEYTPIRSDGVKGEPKVIVSATEVKAAAPHVRKLEIIGPLVENEELSLAVDYYGGIEGASKVQWYRQRHAGSDTDEFDEIEGATNRTFRPTINDVSRKLQVRYYPVNTEGIQGETFVFTTTESVRQGHPAVKSLAIKGDAAERGILTIEVDYFGGVEGNSKIQWLKKKKKKSGDFGRITKLETAANSMTYTAQTDDIGYYIEVQYTPIRSDGVKGSTVSATTESLIIAGPPTVAIALEGNLRQNGKVQLVAEYRGGLEGESKIRWFISNPQKKGKYDHIPDMDNIREYRCREEDFQRRLKVEYTPVRKDGAQGDPVVIESDPIEAGDPYYTDVAISGELQEQQVLTGSAQYHGGVEGSRNHKWTRVHDDGTLEEIEEANSAEYTLSYKDVGCRIQYCVQPVCDNGATGEWYSSEISQVVTALKPPVTGFSLPDIVVEGDTLVPSYEKLHPIYAEEQCRFKWYRIIGETEVEVGTEREYTVSYDDIGHHIKCVMVPVRNDNVEGDPVSSVSTATAVAGKPSAFVSITGDAIEGSTIAVRTTYVGGNEGSSKFRWYRCKTESNEHQLIEDSENSRTYQIKPADVGYYIKIEYVPVRSDGVEGSTTEAVTETAVKPGVPQISSIKLEGRPLESQTIKAVVGQYSGGVEGNSEKRWYRIDPGTGRTVEEIKSAAGSLEYVPKSVDVGYKLRFEYIPVRNDGERGFPLTTDSAIIVPEAPRVENVQIQGVPEVGQTLTATGQYFGGEEGDSEFQWLIAPNKQTLFTPIQGADGTRRTYRPTADDLDCVIKVRYTPVRRADKLRGTPIESAPIAIRMSTSLQQRVNAFLTAIHAEIPVKSALGNEANNWMLEFDNEKAKVNMNGKTLAKEKLNENMKVRFDPDSPTGFTFSLVSGVKEYNLKAATTEDRDLIAITFNAFLALSNKFVASEVLGSSFAQTWKKGKAKKMQEELNQIPGGTTPPLSPSSTADSIVDANNNEIASSAPKTRSRSNSTKSVDAHNTSSNWHKPRKVLAALAFTTAASNNGGAK